MCFVGQSVAGTLVVVVIGICMTYRACDRPIDLLIVRTYSSACSVLR
jgi:hypothetical protein